jgi:hypothetical protein
MAEEEEAPGLKGSKPNSVVVESPAVFHEQLQAFFDKAPQKVRDTSADLDCHQEP